MMGLAEYRLKPALLADYLPWAALIGLGVILNKDGSFQRTARFRGPDLDSAILSDLVATSARLNNALRRLGSGWAIFVEAQRSPAQDYPVSIFPDPISGLVDAERKAQFEEAETHFESAYFLTFVWMPPTDDVSRAGGVLFENAPNGSGDPQEKVATFAHRTDRLFDLLEGFMPEVAWLSDEETLTYLHSTVSSRRQRVSVPDIPIHLDALLTDEPLSGGLTPQLGSRYLKTLTIIGLPNATWPGLLDELNSLALEYRWCTRAICLDKTDATKAFTRIRRQWFAKRKSIAAILKEVMTNEASTLLDNDASNKAADADEALQELGADFAGAVFVTATTTVWDEEPTIEDAMSVVLGALSLLALGIFGPGIANGIVSGGPQLGAGSAVGTAIAAGGVAAGGVAAGRIALGAAGAGARGASAFAGGASSAYQLGSGSRSTTLGSVAGGVASVGKAAAGAATNPLRQSMSDSAQSGARAAYAATGGSSVGPSNPPSTNDGPPAWARRLKQQQSFHHGVSTAAHVIRSGDHGGGGSAVSVSEKP
ncbi:MAG: hypothetical protein Gyms2KO_09900 [Gymnodinialimonas sp.]